MTLEESAGTILISHHDEVAKVLVIRVRKKPLYEIPKGHIEAGETAEVAALRELREETGINVPVMLGTHLGVLEYRFKSFGRHVHKRVQYFLALTEPGLVPECGENLPLIREICWATREEAQEMGWVSTELQALVDQAFELATASEL